MTSILSRTFKEFSESSKAGGIVLILCTLVSLAIANSPLGPAYLDFWHHAVAGLSVELDQRRADGRVLPADRGSNWSVSCTAASCPT